jgi:hypothetical protein
MGAAAAAGAGLASSAKGEAAGGKGGGGGGGGGGAAETAGAASSPPAPAASRGGPSFSPGNSGANATQTISDEQADAALADIPVVQASAGEVRAPEVADASALFAAKPGGPKIVAQSRTTTSAGVVVAFTAGMRIDADGDGGWYKIDKTGKPETSLHYPTGESLNPAQIPFIVVPTDFNKTNPDVQLGDYAAVSYGGKTLYAIVGDRGPAGTVGEGSLVLASNLGINPNPNHGGIDANVHYVILAGSRDKTPPQDPAAVQAAGRALFQKSGISVQ